MAITFSGVEEAKARAERVRQALHDRIEGAMQNWLDTVVDDMQADHPYQDRTGELTGSMGFSLEEFGDGPVAVGVLFAKASYAEAVEYGTAHARPYPYFWPMVYKHLPSLEDELQAATQAAMETP